MQLVVDQPAAIDALPVAVYRTMADLLVTTHAGDQQDLPIAGQRMQNPCPAVRLNWPRPTGPSPTPHASFTRLSSNSPSSLPHTAMITF